LVAYFVPPPLTFTFETIVLKPSAPPIELRDTCHCACNPLTSADTSSEKNDNDPLPPLLPSLNHVPPNSELDNFSMALDT
jgi:hypothetical protein